MSFLSFGIDLYQCNNKKYLFVYMSQFYITYFSLNIHNVISGLPFSFENNVSLYSEQIILRSHESYERCSLRLGGPIPNNFLWPIAFPATLQKFEKPSFWKISDYFLFSSNKNDRFGRFGQPIGHVAILKISASIICLRKNLKSRTTPNRCWDIFIFVNGP